MNRFARFVAPAVAAFALFAGASMTRAADTENPEYKSWAGQKPGTVVKYHMTTAGATKMEMDRSVKLIEVKPDAVTVEDTTVMDMNGTKINTPAQKRSIPAKGAAAGAAPNAGAAGGAAAKESEESVDVAGKAYKCKVVEASNEANGMKTKSKTWTSTDVPGYIVKMTATTEGAVKSETSMTLTGIDAAK
jgi:hypothetical protein